MYIKRWLIPLLVLVLPSAAKTPARDQFTPVVASTLTPSVLESSGLPYMIDSFDFPDKFQKRSLPQLPESKEIGAPDYFARRALAPDNFRWT